MLRLIDVREELSIDPSETRDDAFLIRCIEQATALIRQRTDRYLFGVTDSIVQAEATRVIVRCISHGMITSEIVYLANTNCTPSIDGNQEITYIDCNHFSVVADITVSGDAGTVHPVRVFEQPIKRGGPILNCTEAISPFAELRSVEIRESMQTWTLLPSTSYRISGDTLVARSVNIERLDAPWVVEMERVGGPYGLRQRQRVNNVRFVVALGSLVIPVEIQMAAYSYVFDLYERQGAGKEETSSSYEGAKSSRPTGDERMNAMISMDRVVSSWRARR